MDKEELLKRMEGLYERAHELGELSEGIRQDIFALMDDVEIYLVDYIESEE